MAASAAAQPEITALSSPLPDGVVGVKVKIPQVVLDAASGKGAKRTIYIALDTSGSMTSSIALAKNAVIELISDIRYRVQVQDIVVVFYSSSASTYFSSDDSIDQVKARFRTVKATGGTNFTEVFGYLASLIDNRTTNPAVVFLSDGQDTSDNSEGKKNLENAFGTLRLCLCRGGMASEVHSIGFTPEHDAVLLGKIARLGTVQGSFQYVRVKDELAAAATQIVEYLGGKKISVQIELANGAVVPVFLNDMREGLVFLDENDLARTGQVLTVKVGENVHSVNVAADDPRNLAAFTVKFLEEKINQFSRRITEEKPARDELMIFKKKVDEYDEQLNNLIKDSFKLSSAGRKEAIGAIQDVKELVGRFHELLASALANSLTNDKIATFASLAYKNVKRGLQKKLDKRLEKNIELFEGLEGKIADAVASVDFNQLNSATPEDKKETLTCALSFKNFIEAMEDGDCMCLCLNVSRSPAAIADPTQLQIHAVTQTLMTADSFMESVRYAVEGVEAPTAEQKHGGFVRNAISSIVKGLAREAITGCMPLYINEQHWQVAKHKMKPIMGWLCTLDIMGYSFSQVRSVPFLVMSKLVEESAGDSEFKKFQLDHVLKTCQQIYIDAKMSQEVLDFYHKYPRDAMNRTIDVIANNFVFLGQLACAARNGDLILDKTALEELEELVAEEEIRRRMNYNSFDGSAAKKLLDLLGVDMEKYYYGPLRKYKQEYKAFTEAVDSQTSASSYSLNMRTLLNEPVNPLLAADSPAASAAPPSMPTLQAPEFSGEDISVTNVAKQFIEATNGHCTKALHLVHQLFNLIKGEDVKEDYSLPLNFNVDTLRVLALYLQNYEQCKNSDRRDAIAAGRYWNPFRLNNHHVIFKHMVDKIIVADRQKEINDLLAAEAAKNSNTAASTFFKTKDIFEAAGVVRECLKFQGTPAFRAFYEILYNPGAPLVFEKIQMLVTGQYRSIKLIKDEIKKRDDPRAPITWKPSRKHFAKLWRNNIDAVTREQWEALFPERKDKIARKYDSYAREMAGMERFP